VIVDEKVGGRAAPIHAGAYVLLAVTDTGQGMDAMTRAGSSSILHDQGARERNGIGLATVYGVVKQSGGCILGDSEPGKERALKFICRVSRKERSLKRTRYSCSACSSNRDSAYRGR